jgi:hypothetical protein
MKPRQPARDARCQCLIDGMYASGDPLDTRERFEERNRDASIDMGYAVPL